MWVFTWKMSELEIVKFVKKLIIGTECSMEYVIRSILELHNLYPYKAGNNRKHLYAGHLNYRVGSRKTYREKGCHSILAIILLEK